MSRLGGTVLSDWGVSVKIGGKCQDWGSGWGDVVRIVGMLSGLGGSHSGGIAIGLGVYCQNWGHETPNSDARHQSCLSLYWGYEAPNPVHVLAHLGL